MFGWFKSKQEKQSSRVERQSTLSLLEQCHKWEEHDQYDQIIATLSALPEQDNTPDIDFMLGLAYFRNANKSEQSEHYKLKLALKYLLPHREHFAEDAQWHDYVGSCFFFLDLTYLAFPYFRRASTLNPNDERIKKHCMHCELDLAGPLFKYTDNLFDRVEAMWQNFGKLEATWRQTCETQGPSVELLEDIKTNCDQIFAPFELGYFVKMSPQKEYNYLLVFNVSSQLGLLLPLKLLLAKAPESIKEHWQIQTGFAQIDSPFIDRGNISIQTKDIALKLVPTKHEEAELGFALNPQVEQTSLQKFNAQYILAVHHAAMAELKHAVEASDSEESREELGEFYGACLDLIHQNLGEIATCLAFSEIGMIPELVNFDNIQSPTLTLEQLPQELRDQGYNLNLSLTDIIEARRFDYVFKPQQSLQDGSGYHIREDIFQGYTYFREMLFEFAQNTDAKANLLHSVGASTGFFAYTLSSHDGCTEISQERQKMQDTLIEIVSDFEGFEVIGTAFGLEHDYIDIFCGAFYPDLFQAVCSFIAEHEDDFESIQFYSFRPGFSLQLFG